MHTRSTTSSSRSVRRPAATWTARAARSTPLRAQDEYEMRAEQLRRPHAVERPDDPDVQVAREATSLCGEPRAEHDDAVRRDARRVADVAEQIAARLHAVGSRVRRAGLAVAVQDHHRDLVA